MEIQIKVTQKGNEGIILWESYYYCEDELYFSKN